MPLTIFCHLFSKTMVKYSMMGSQSHLGLTFQWPWCMFLHSALVLQRSSPRPSSSAHSPAPCAPLFFFQGGQHTWTLPVMPHPFWLPQAPAGLNHPWRDSALLLHQLREIVYWAISGLPKVFQHLLAKAQAVILHAKNEELGPLVLHIYIQGKDWVAAMQLCWEAG